MIRRIVIVAIGFLLVAASAETLRLRDFRQLQAHFSDATGVSNSLYNIRLIARQVKDSLPVNSDVENYNSSVVKAASKLAAAYCVEFLRIEKRTPASERRAHKLVDFSLSPEHLSDEVLKNVAAVYANLFWNRTPTMDEANTLLAAATTARDGSVKTPAGTLNTLVALCAVVGSSLDSLIIRN